MKRTPLIWNTKPSTKVNKNLKGIYTPYKASVIKSFPLTSLKTSSKLKAPQKINFFPTHKKSSIKQMNNNFSFIPKKSPKFVPAQQFLSPYASKTAKKVKRIDMNWIQAKQKNTRLNPWGDADKDGVVNMFDCHPYDPKRDGVFSTIGKGISNVASGIAKAAAPTVAKVATTVSNAEKAVAKALTPVAKVVVPVVLASPVGKVATTIATTLTPKTTTSTSNKTSATTPSISSGGGGSSGGVSSGATTKPEISTTSTSIGGGGGGGRSSSSTTPVVEDKLTSIITPKDNVFTTTTPETTPIKLAPGTGGTYDARSGTYTDAQGNKSSMQKAPSGSTLIGPYKSSVYSPPKIKAPVPEPIQPKPKIRYVYEPAQEIVEPAPLTLQGVNELLRPFAQRINQPGVERNFPTNISSAYEITPEELSYLMPTITGARGAPKYPLILNINPLEKKRPAFITSALLKLQPRITYSTSIPTRLSVITPTGTEKEMSRTSPTTASSRYVEYVIKMPEV
jgi:hypothetical protein